MAKLELIKAEKARVKRHRRSTNLRRVVLVPDSRSNLILLDAESFYILTLHRTVELELPEAILGYEPLEGS